MRRQETEGERGWSEQKGGDDGRGKAGRADFETLSTRQVCAEVRRGLRGEVGESDRRR